jgi:hypothetical protein
MFPVDFVLGVIERYTEQGDLVVDPFCGRGTTLYLSEALERHSFGVEVNSVGWTYAATKLGPAPQHLVLHRLKDVARRAAKLDIPALPPFFSRAYSPQVRRFLTAARQMLNWRSSSVDRTLMSTLLLYAHGNRNNALSNQMRQTKAMAPVYALKWWAARELDPPTIDPVDFLEPRIKWRYAHGRPRFTESTAIRGDSGSILSRHRERLRGWSLLLTSPPYMKIANYHYDQWIRLWLLGGAPHPVVNGGKHQSWFQNRHEYRELLTGVFGRLARHAKRDAVVYVRTDARPVTREITLEVLRDVFPRKNIRTRNKPLTGDSQTVLYNSAIESPGEVDIILS